jgi:hypothetical protein
LQHIFWVVYNSSSYISSHIDYFTAMFTHLKQHQKTIAAIILLALVSGILFYAFVANAAVRTWDNGGGDGLWSTCTNWSSDTCPTSADIATFDGTSTADATIDAAFAGSVAGIDINSGYTGTIRQQRNLTIGANSYAQDSGTFLQGPFTFDINDGSFSLGAGTFSTATGTDSIERNFTVSGGTYTASSTKTLIFDGTGSSENSTFTYSGVFPGILRMGKTNDLAFLTLASGLTVVNVGSSAGNAGGLVVNNGASIYFGNNSMIGGSLTINGTLYASSTIDLSRNFSLGSTGVFHFAGPSINVELNYTDSGGTTVITSSPTITFDGTGSSDNSTVSCTGNLPFTSLSVNKTSGVHANFILSAGCNATSTTISTAADIFVNGILATQGNQLSPFSLTVSSGAILRAYANQTMTAPTLGSGSTVDYYGTGTYTTLAGGTSYHHVKFSAGTYNLASNINVAGNLTTTGGTFNQTSGTATFTGTANTISGNHTFNNLTKTVSSASTLTFAAGSTQTVTGTTTLTGTGGATRLTLQSSTPTSQWLINPSGTRVLNYLAITDGNNTSGSPIICYGAVDCTDGGNNTNILFVQPPNPPPVLRLKGGTRIIGGTSLH